MTINPNKGENKRQLAAKETKNKIERAALELFEEHGFDIVTIEDITQVAGVSKGSFYVYFSSKDQILVNEYKKIDKYYEKVYKNIPPELSAIGQIKMLSMSLLEYCESNLGVEIIRVMYSNQISVNAIDAEHKFLKDDNRVLHQLLGKMIAKGIADGEIKAETDPRLLMTLLNTCYHGILYDWCLYNGSFKLTEYGMHGINILIDSVCT